MEYFGSMKPKRKKVTHSNVSKPKKEYNILEDSQKASEQGVATQIKIIEDTLSLSNKSRFPRKKF